jgi:hypothetical protein
MRALKKEVSDFSILTPTGWLCKLVGESTAADLNGLLLLSIWRY